MTVGQRIAQKRKELGLSQEGLGERLGVSRQAIYKWESDAALPEIEKLVNLSREFSVSIDWLLGQEDESRAPGELTPEQLRMVEEIVERYLAALPKPEPSTVPKGEEPEPPKKRRWPYVLAAVVLAGIFYNLFSQLDQMHWENQNLQMAVANVRADVNSQIYGITSRVEDILQSQNRLTAEQSARVTSTDYRANTVTISARAVPRTYVEGMTAEFVLVSGGETVTVPAQEAENRGFTADLTGPLSDEVTVSVAFLTGNQRETQVVEQFEGLHEMSLPVVIINGHVALQSKAQWIANQSVDVIAYYAWGDDAPEIKVNLGLFRERKLVVWYTQVDRKNMTGEMWEFRLEEEIPLDLDVPYCLAALVTDEYGRSWMYNMQEERICREGEGFSVGVSSELYSTDPADWGL